MTLTDEAQLLAFRRRLALDAAALVPFANLVRWDWSQNAIGEVLGALEAASPTEFLRDAERLRRLVDVATILMPTWGSC